MIIIKCDCGAQYQPLSKSEHLAGKKHQAWEARKNLVATIHEATGVPSAWINSHLKKGYAPNQDWQKLYENFSDRKIGEADAYRNIYVHLQWEGVLKPKHMNL